MGIFKSLSTAMRLIFRDPINLGLMMVPTAIALSLYLFLITITFKNSDVIVVTMRDYIHSPEAAGWLGKIFTAILIIFIFFLMSWTFIVVVGFIAAPFNSLLSSRIEKKLLGQAVVEDKSQTIHELVRIIGFTFKNELKKILFILFVGGIAFFFNLFPLFYPIGLFLIACLMAVQFIDYSWSRHDMPFSACLKDLLSNIIPYTAGGFLFLLLITVPIINAFVPALATGYFTVLWLHRHKKIPLTP